MSLSPDYDSTKRIGTMKKICFYSPPYPRVKSCYDMIDIAAQYGLNAFEGLSIWELSQPDIEQAKKIREYADSKNVTCPCLSAFVRFAHGKENVDRLKKYADIAKILGSPYLHHTIVGEFADPLKVLPYKDELFADGIHAVREVYDYAQSIGIKTIFEEQGYIFNGIRGFGEFLDNVRRDVGVVADFANIYEAGDDFLDFLSAFKDRVVHAHIKDVTLSASNPSGRGLRTLDGKFMYEARVGEGIVKFKEAMRILNDIGYDGYYGLEYSAKADNSPDITDALNFIQSL